MLNIIQVGGSVRDELLGLPVNDIDFAVEVLDQDMTVDQAYEYMRSTLTKRGYVEYLSKPDYVTLRCRVPEDFPFPGVKDADFTICRKDGAREAGTMRDCRTELGTLQDDAMRRDFTINALYKESDGTILDPTGDGLRDLERKVIRPVGSALDRFEEDPLRFIRGLRFAVQKGFQLSYDFYQFNTDYGLRGQLAEGLKRIPAERRQAELGKMFSCDTIKSGDMIFGMLHYEIQEAIFSDGLWLKLPSSSHPDEKGRITLEPTLKKKKGLPQTPFDAKVES